MPKSKFVMWGPLSVGSHQNTTSFYLKRSKSLPKSFTTLDLYVWVREAAFLLWTHYQIHGRKVNLLSQESSVQIPTPTDLINSCIWTTPKSWFAVWLTSWLNAPKIIQITNDL